MAWLAARVAVLSGCRRPFLRRRLSSRLELIVAVGHTRWLVVLVLVVVVLEDMRGRGDVRCKIYLKYAGAGADPGAINKIKILYEFTWGGYRPSCS